ncbi:MAG: hypothetical protein O8C66_16055 [Candidatus Methanoperedens sp.]|nr:hypothetical protein [Candidatus Methanoperedens sp.]MCZ7372009.1 hypothetical protein [Candidatus Methanoperedens sp.]
MEFNKLTKVIFDEIKPKIECSLGLSIFAKERAKFEGWLKVELCNSLLKYFKDIIPEKDRVDITFENWAIELKTVNTNIRYKNVKNKTRPITDNIQGVVNDIEKLKSMDYANKAILFVVFPITHDNENWQIQLQRISTSVREISYINFNFEAEIPGVIYFCLI